MCGQVIFEQACSEEFQIFVFYFSCKEHKTQNLTINESHYGQKRHEVFSVIKSNIICILLLYDKFYH